VEELVGFEERWRVFEFVGGLQGEGVFFG